jgi:hypothetical protein
VRNSPSNFFDPSGQTCTSNITYLGQWLVGAGQRDRFYGPGDPETKEMAGGSPIEWKDFRAFR